MTRAEWDALGAREKDAIVAEKVMGWGGRFLLRRMKNEGPFSIAFSSVPKGATYTRFDYSRWWREDGVKLYCGKPHCVYHPKYYTISWDDVREVVEKMSVDEWFIETSRDCSGWFVSIEPWLGALRYTATAPTFPEAVCIAALTALGHLDPA